MPQGENNKSVVKRESYESSTRNDGKNYLLVIGIDDYAHCPTLYNAVKDAQDIVEVLENRFRFDTENITTLYNEKATKRNIYNAFRSFIKKVTSQDNFLVYFSGHGEFDKDFGVGYWIPVNAELGSVDAYIPNSEIKNFFSAIKSHHTFLMADSCFSGTLFDEGQSKNISHRLEKDPSRWGLTAGRNEIVKDGKPGKNSPFAKGILKQLRNVTSSIGVQELCVKVVEIVAANTNQTPRGEPLKVKGHEGGQFVFHLKMNKDVDWKDEVEESTKAFFPIEKKTIENTKIKSSPTSKSVSRGQSDTSFFEKYRTYLLLLLLPILGYSIYQAIGNGGNYITQNDDKPIKETSIPTDLVPIIPPLEFDFSWGKDVLIVTVKGGEPPYFLQLSKGGQQKYSTQLNVAKRKEIPILESYREDAGKYQLIVKDSKGKSSIKVINVDPPRINEAEKNNNQETLVNISTNSDTFKDSRDGTTYRWVRLKDGKKWMAQNLNYKAVDSWSYDNKSSNGAKYGRLYTWQSAMKACPSGWRLPTDDEWWKMASYYGKVYSSSENNIRDNIDTTTYKNLMQGGSSGLSILLGGGRYSNGDFSYLDKRGLYWSSSEQKTSYAWYYTFSSHRKYLYRSKYDKNVSRSCRCLQD